MTPPPGLIVPPPVEPLEVRIAPAASVLDLATLNGTNGFVLNGPEPGDLAGFDVSNAGDVNGDTFPDFVISAPQSDAVVTDAGGLCVIFGTPNGFPRELGIADINGTNGFLLGGEALGDEAGFSVSAGDVNGDGFSDLIIGAPYASPNVNSSGAVYLVLGRSSFPALLNLGVAGVGITKFIGENVGDGAGFSVSTAGDFNNDGKDDILIGAPNASGAVFGDTAGAAYVVFGATSFPNPFNLASLNLSNGFKVQGEFAQDGFGFSVSNAGDINKDGFDDIVAGALDADSGQTDTGAAYVIFGQPNLSGPILLSNLNGGNGFRIYGESNGDSAGASVSGAGDLNRDGFADIVVGAPGADAHGENSGAAYVIYGKAGGFTSTLDLSSVANVIGFKIQGAGAGDAAGAAISGAGDFNNDGFSDLIVGAPGAASTAGTAYVVMGSSKFSDLVDLSQLDGKVGFLIRGEVKGDLAGFSVSMAGDLNRDGFADLLVGARGADPTGEDAGRAYIVYGFDTRVTVAPNGQAVTFTEADGDVVTLQLSVGGLSPQDVVLAPDGSIQSLDLTSFAGPSKIGGHIKPLNVSIGVKTPAGTSGDGFTKVGFLNADGVTLGKLKLKGDLGRLVAGLNSGGVAAKSISISGNLGSLTGASVLSQIFGGIGKLKVNGSFLQNSIQVGGKVNSVKITGDYTGDPAISTAMLADIAEEGFAETIEQLGLPPAGVFLAESIRSLKIGGTMKGGGITTTKDLGVFSVFGDLRNGNLFGGGGIKAVKVVGRVTSDDPNDPVTITARNKLGSLVINGDVENARILAGYNTNENPVNADATVGKVLVKGDWIASSLVAGIDDVTNDGFGRNDIIISGDTTSAVSKIARVVIKGIASGTAVAGDHYGITAQQIGKVSIGGELVPLTGDADDILVDTTNNDFRIVEIAAP